MVEVLGVFDCSIGKLGILVVEVDGVDAETVYAAVAPEFDGRFVEEFAGKGIVPVDVGSGVEEEVEVVSVAGFDVFPG